MSDFESGFDPALFKQISADPRPRSNPQAEIQRDTERANQGIKPIYNRQLQVDYAIPRQGVEHDRDFQSNILNPVRRSDVPENQE
jgi:hypothetical protein